MVVTSILLLGLEGGEGVGSRMTCMTLPKTASDKGGSFLNLQGQSVGERYDESKPCPGGSDDGSRYLQAWVSRQ